MNNTSKDKCLIVVHTEIGLLMGLLYYIKYIKDKKQASFFLIKASEDRFENMNLKYLPGEYKVLIDEVSANFWTPNHSFKEILNYDDISELIVQNPLNFFVDITINHYKKRFSNIKLTMLTDGVIMLSPLRLKSYIQWSLKHVFRKYYNRIAELPLFVRQYTDMVSDMDYLIAHQNIGVKNFINTESLFDDITKYHDIISGIFNIDIEVYKKAKFIFFTQLIHEHKGFNQKYFNLLDKLVTLSKKNKINIIFKIHPADDIRLYESYQSELLFIDSSNKNLPAEVLMKMLNDKIIVSVASSLSLSNLNSTLHHFWLSNLIGYHVDPASKVNHIEMPSSIEELESKVLSII